MMIRMYMETTSKRVKITGTRKSQSLTLLDIKNFVAECEAHSIPSRTLVNGYSDGVHLFEIEAIDTEVVS